MQRQSALLAMLLAAQVLLAQAPPSTLAAPKDPIQVATAFIDLLLKGDYPPADALEGGPMKEAALAAKLSEIWTGIQTQLGAYKRRLGTRTEKQTQYDMIFVTTAFEHQTVDLKVVIDDDGRVVGFFILPVQPAVPPADAAPPAYAWAKGGSRPSAAGRTGSSSQESRQCCRIASCPEEISWSVWTGRAISSALTIPTSSSCTAS